MLGNYKFTHPGITRDFYIMVILTVVCVPNIFLWITQESCPPTLVWRQKPCSTCKSFPPLLHWKVDYMALTGHLKLSGTAGSSFNHLASLIKKTICYIALRSKNWDQGHLSVSGRAFLKNIFLGCLSQGHYFKVENSSFLSYTFYILYVVFFFFFACMCLGSVFSETRRQPQTLGNNS